METVSTSPNAVSERVEYNFEKALAVGEKDVTEADKVVEPRLDKRAICDTIGMPEENYQAYLYLLEGV